MKIATKKYEETILVHRTTNLKSVVSTTNTISDCLKSTVLIMVSNSDFTRFLVFSIRFIETIKNGKHKITIIIKRQVPKKINHKADQNAYNVNNYYYLI